jgi:hypothetical protein
MNRFVTGNLLFSLSQAGCSHDPKIRKQRFLAQRDQAFQKASSLRLPFAMDKLSRLILVSRKHTSNWHTRMRMSSWMTACQEFRRTVELQPENWQAQLSLCPWNDIT